MKVEILVRGRFIPIPDAVTRHTHANVWEIRFPKTPELARVLHGELTPERFDGATIALDGHEVDQAIGSGESTHTVSVTVRVDLPVPE